VVIIVPFASKNPFYKKGFFELLKEKIENYKRSQSKSLSIPHISVSASSAI